MQITNFLQSVSKRVDKTLTRFFYNEAFFIAKHPFLVVFLTVALTSGLGTLGYYTFAQEWNPEHLYAPVDSPSAVDKDYIRNEFGFEPLIEHILITGEDHENILAPEVIKRNLEELLEIWTLIENIELSPPPPIQLTSALNSVCRNSGPGTPCKVQSVLDAWEYNIDKIRVDPDPLDTLNSKSLVDVYGHPLDMEVILGGVERLDNGTIVEAKAFQIAFQLDQNFEDYEKAVFDAFMEEQSFSSEQVDRLDRYQELLDDGFDPRAYAFDEDMSRALKNWGKYNNETHLKVYISSLYEVERESQDSIKSDLLWIGLSIVLVSFYSSFFLFRNSWIYCKSHMVIFGTLSVAMAVVSSFGLALGLGIKYNLVIQSVPFLLIGLGLDDTYIIIGALNKVSVNLPYQQRVAFAISSAGSSIFVTSMTDLVAFLVGMFTNIPALKSFGFYASLGVFFDFFYQVTFFVAIVVFEAKREEYFNPPQNSESSNLAPQNVDHESSKHNKSEAESDNQSQPQTVSGSKKIFGTGNFDPQQPTLGMTVFGDWFATMILSRSGKAIVLIIEIIGLSFAIYGCTNVYMDFRYKQWFAPKGSQLKDAFRIEEEYFNGDQNPFVIYTKDPDDGSYFDYYSQMQDLFQGQKSNPFVSQTPMIKSWFGDYAEWLENHPEQLRKSQLNSTTFIETVKTYLETQQGEYYKNHILFNGDETSIRSSIFLEGYSTHLDTGQEAVDFMDNLREVNEESAPNLKPIAFDLMFLFYDSLRVAVQQTVKNVVLAGVAVFLLCMITLADIGGALLVLLMVSLTDIALFGAMWYLDINFNMVTSINAILAVGIAVDYSAHITHNFLKQRGTLHTRTKEALRSIGPEVFAGGVSTWLAAAGLIPAEHYIMEVFFKMITVIVAAGLWHGLILLPVLLR
eukprot:g432.t1